EDVLREIANTRRITSHVARKRQLGYLAKIMRKYDDDAFIKTRAELGEDRAQMRRETAAMHRLEDWRERLIEDDAALEVLIEKHPDGDRQHLRSLIRQARHKKGNNKFPRAFRKIFQLLKQLSSDFVRK